MDRSVRWVITVLALGSGLLWPVHSAIYAQGFHLEARRGQAADVPCQLTIQGPEAQPLELQVSTDLLGWVSLATLTNAVGTQPFSDTSAAGLSWRYYRAVPATGAAAVQQAPYGTAGTKPVTIFTLTNAAGVEARICTYGGILVSLKVPDRQGQFADVVLGYDRLGSYIGNNPYFGALIGRYANRIANGRFTLDGKTYTLAINDSPNSLHGGNKGFDKVVWNARPCGTATEPALELTYLSKDLEENYPGNLSVRALYTLTRDNAIRLDYTATTDKDTIINLTQHTYFNLAATGTILDHEVTIYADQFTPINSVMIPTGEIKAVAGTPFDFTQPHKIGERIGASDPQLRYASGYDHNWVLTKAAGALDVIARVYEPTSGRVLEVLSTEPGLQFYSGNFLNGSNIGKGGVPYIHRSGFTMEPQHFPDSPNKPQFPSVVLKPGQVYRNTIIYRFSVR